MKFNIKKLIQKSKQSEGFTLIEMLLVLLVISVLIILIIPNIAAQSKNVQNTGCDAQVKMVYLYILKSYKELSEVGLYEFYQINIYHKTS